MSRFGCCEKSAASWRCAGFLRTHACHSGAARDVATKSQTSNRPYRTHIRFMLNYTTTPILTQKDKTKFDLCLPLDISYSEFFKMDCSETCATKQREGPSPFHFVVSYDSPHEIWAAKTEDQGGFGNTLIWRAFCRTGADVRLKPEPGLARATSKHAHR